MHTHVVQHLYLFSRGWGNRCADCDAELTDYGNIWASVDQGCFVCVHCLAVHRSLGFRTKSVNMDFWAVDEVARMTSMGNIKVSNASLSRSHMCIDSMAGEDAQREYPILWKPKSKHLLTGLMV